MNTCKICQKEFEYKWGKKMTCSQECLTKWKTSDEYINSWKKKVQDTTMKKYGVEHTSMVASVKEKSKNTFLKKYGAVSPTLNPEIRKKQIATNRKRYGADSPLQNEEVQNKVRESLKKSYGVESPFSSKEIQKLASDTRLEKYGDVNYNNPRQAEKTNLERYGVAHVTQDAAIREKIKRTCLKNHGVEYALQSPVIRKKSIATNLVRYGTKNPAQSEKVKEKTNRTKFIKHYALIKARFSDSVVALFPEKDYDGSRPYTKKYPFKCVKCENEFLSTLYVSDVPRCQKCYPFITTNTSLMEKEILNEIKLLISDKELMINDRSILVGQELDIYLPKQKLAFEMNGNYWHSEIVGKRPKNYHLNKTQKCEAAGISLIHIFEDEWISNKEIIINKLKYLLRPDCVKKIYARKCEIKFIDSSTSNEFLERIHLQGADNAPIRYGAYYKDTLVAVMTFGKARVALGGDPKSSDYELYRFCSVGKITGILSKFISRFIADHSPKKIITYADRRFSNRANCSYEKCGFTFIKSTMPNYWYLDKSYHKRLHRFQFRKSELKKKLAEYSDDLTEWQNMKLNGYDRIWDCGHLKYELIP